MVKSVIAKTWNRFLTGKTWAKVFLTNNSESLETNLKGSDDLLKSPKSPLKSPLNLLKCGLMVYIIPQFIIISYISILVCMIL